MTKFKPRLHIPALAANQRLHDGFLKAGFSIPFPQMDVHVLKEAPEDPV